jgi:hypothetical protein
MSEVFSVKYQKPWISLTYDGFPETSNIAKIGNFAEVINFCAPPKEAEPAAVA